MTKSNQKLLHAFETSLSRSNSSVHTVTGYVSDVRSYLAWFQERQPSARATITTRADVLAYRVHLRDELKRKPSTINRHLLSLRRFFAFTGKPKTNPAAEIPGIRAPKSGKPPGLTDAEVQRLLVAAGKSFHGQGPRNYALIQLILQTGLRVQELVNLVGEDLSIQQRSGTLQVRSQKAYEERLVPLNSTIRRALKKYFEQRGFPQAADAVFLSTRGDAIAKRSVQYVVGRCAERAKIDRISVGPQMLRHTFALRFLDESPDDHEGLAELLGHDRVETTAIYTRPKRK